MGVLFITHDLDLAAAVCDRVHVMYAGRIVETRARRRPLRRAAAPVHRRACWPRRRTSTAATTGSSPCRDLPSGLLEQPSGCAFAARCAYVDPERCLHRATRPRGGRPGSRRSACVRSGEVLAASWPASVAGTEPVA